MTTQTHTAPTATVTTEPYGAASEFVYLDGRLVGDICDTLAQPKGARHGSYFFPDREAAIAACVSYATRGYWTGELR